MYSIVDAEAPLLLDGHMTCGEDEGFAIPLDHGPDGAAVQAAVVHAARHQALELADFSTP